MDPVSLVDFACDGVTDDSDAWARMLTWAGASPATIALTGPTYLGAAGLSLPGNVSIAFAGGSVRSAFPIAWAGGIIAPPYPIFTGAAPVLWAGAAQAATPLYPQWWGAAGNPVSTTGTIAAGSTALTVASAAGWTVGHGIAVEGADASGGTLVTRVAGVIANAITLALPAATSVAGAPVHHDDSVALQAALDTAARGLEIRVNDGLYYACEDLIVANAAGLRLIGASSYGAQIRKPPWAVEHDCVLAVSGFSLEIGHIGIDSAPCPATASGWAANVGLCVQGYPQPGVPTGTVACHFHDLRIRCVGTGLELGNWDVDGKDPNIETNTFERLSIDSVNVGIFEDGQNILHNPMRGCWIANMRDHAALQRRGSDLWFERSYFGPWGDALNGNAKPPNANAKIEVDAGNVAIIGCRSEDQDPASTHPFAYVNAPNASFILFQANTVTHNAPTGQAAFPSIALVGVGASGAQANQGVLIANDTQGYLSIDNLDVVSIGNRYHGVGVGVVNGVLRSPMQANANNNAKEFTADWQAPATVAKGRVAVTGFPAGPPAAGTWTAGDYVRNTTVCELGTAGAKYVVKGWICIAAGTPGIWVQDRALTGN